jgi:hypothetical protein
VSGGISAACGDPFFANQTRVGWLFGAGIEHFFARHWSLKLEYNHMEFGGRSVSFFDEGTDFFTEEIHQRINLVKLGISYHFSAAAADPALRAYGAAMKAPSATVEESFNRVMAFSGTDASKYSVSAWVGALIAPRGDLDTSGLRIVIAGEGGAYKYRDNGGFIRGVNTGGQVLVGHAAEGDNYSIKLLIGVNASNHMLSAVDLGNSVQGTQFGAKVRGDAWINPTAQTMVYGEAEYSTAFRTYQAALKFGYDVTNTSVFVGPEVAALGDERSNQWRVGAHLTQLKLGRVEVDVSGGYAKDSSVGASAYGSIGLNTNF